MSDQGCQADFDKYIIFNLPAGIFQVAADKKYYWYIDPKCEKDESTQQLYATGELVSKTEDSVTINGEGGKITVPIEKAFERNPGRFDGENDCANLSHLSEATVMYNPKLRYFSDVIHTYSGLFLVVVNPYKRFPIYTPYMVERFRGRRRDELPPHIFAVADECYRQMLNETRNQSLLITGESGAGKTENTKKVIQYLTFIAGKTEFGKPGELEEQLLVANPIMESFGNACTNKNNNSSRFGKFIQLQFNSSGGIIGAKISIYLLEKSRVVSQLKGERNYHIFYQLLTGAPKEMKSMFHLEDPKYYNYTNQGDRYILDDMDDDVEFKNLIESFKIMKVDEDEQKFVYSVVAGILHLGNVEFSDEKDGAEVADDTSKQELSLAAECFGVTDIALRKAIIEPAMKVGDREVINQHLDKNAAYAARDALAKATYQRLFMWMVKKLNEVLAQKSESWYIGVLDIAGFEIFKKNSFEQLCINFTNEHLQHFFNQFMFKLEQEEYTREKIEWKFVNFGMDLQPTIDLIEQKNPPGILSLLDENSVTKSNDSAFLQKLNQYFGKQRKHPKFKESQFAGSTFSIYHYAGIVEYDVTDWVNKNRDLFISDLDTCMKNSKINFIAKLFKEDYGIAGMKSDAVPGKGNRGAAFLTVGLQHKEQLNSLMTSLRNTTPHFVRCILPNKSKKQHVFEEKVVVDQLKCNGVLEGIRITRMGYPNRIVYAEFLKRYYLLGKGVPRTSSDTKAQVGILMDQLKISKDQYQLGLTKIFFKVGILATIEEMREKKIAEMILGIQACCRAFLSRKRFVQLKQRTISAVLIQNSVRAYIELKNWPWWKLFQKIRPLLKRRNFENEIKERENQIKALKDQIAELEKDKQDQKALLDAANSEVGNLTNQLNNAKSDIDNITNAKNSSDDERAKLSSEIMMLNDDIQSYLEQINSLKKKLLDSDDQAEDMLEAINEKEAKRKSLEAIVKKYENEVAELQKALEDEKEQKKQLEELKSNLDEEAHQLSDQLEDANTKVMLLNKTKQKLENELDALQEKYDNESENKDSISKDKKALESQLLQLNSDLDDANAKVKELTDKLAKTEEERNTFQGKFEEEQKNRQALEKQKKDLDFQKQELEEELASAQSNCDSLAAKLKQLEKDNNEMQQQISEGQDVTQIMQKQRQKTEAELESLKKQVEQLTAKVAQLEKDKRALENELTIVKHQLDEAQNDNATLQKQKATLEKQLAAANAELNNTDKTKAEVERVKRVLEREKAEIEADLEKAQKERDDALEKVKEKDEQIAGLSSEHDNMSQGKSNLEARIRSLQQELTLTSGQRDDEKNAKEALEKRRKALEDELTECRDNLDAAEERERKLARDLKDKTAAYEQLEKDVASATSDKDASSDKVKQLTKENEALIEAADDANNKLLSYESTIKKLQRDLDEAREKEDIESKARLAAERNKRKLDGEFAAMKSKYAALESSSADNLVKLRTVNEEADNLRQELEGQDTKISELSRQKKGLEAQVEALKQQLSDTEDDLKKQTDRAKKAEAQLAAELENPSGGGVPTELLAQKEAEIEEVRQKLQAELDSHKANDDKMKELRSQLQDAKEQVEVLKQQKEGAEANNKRSEATIADLRKELDETSRKAKTLDDNCKRMAVDLKSLTAKLQGTVTSKAMDSDEVQRLKAQIQQLVTDLDNERKQHGESEIKHKVHL